MCMINPTTLTPKIAKADIVCIKVLEHAHNQRNFRTPFNEVPVLSENFYADKLDPSTLLDVGNRRSVSHGIHTYNLSCYADNNITTKTKMFLYGYDFECGYDMGYDRWAIKCIIPKGTAYYENAINYCSEMIHILNWKKLQKKLMDNYNKYNGYH